MIGDGVDGVRTLAGLVGGDLVGNGYAGEEQGEDGNESDHNLGIHGDYHHVRDGRSPLNNMVKSVRARGPQGLVLHDP